MSEASAAVRSSVDKMILSHFMRDFSAQVHEDVTFLQSLSPEEKAVFERAGHDTRKHALIGAVTAPAVLWAAKRAVVQFAGARLPTVVKSASFTMKTLSVTAYIAASIIGGFQQAQQAVPTNIERLVSLPPPSSIGARARASVVLVNQQAKTHVPQDKQQEFQLATARYTRLFPAGVTGEEHALKGAANPFQAAEAFRDSVLKRSAASGSVAGNSGSVAGDGDFIETNSSSSSSREQVKPGGSAVADQSSSRGVDAGTQPPPSPAVDRPRRRSSYDPPVGRDAAPADPGSKTSNIVKTPDIVPARRVVYNKWGDVVEKDDTKP